MLSRTVIRTKHDLIKLAAFNAPSKACEQSINAGRVQCIGGFRVPGQHPFWVIVVDGLQGGEWVLKIECNETHRCYHVSKIKTIQIPFAYYDHSTPKEMLG